MLWRLYLSSLACVLLSMAIFTTWLSCRDAQDSLSELRNQQRLLATIAASQIETGYHDQIWPFEMLWAIAKEPQFVFWDVTNGNDKVVLSEGRRDVAFDSKAPALKEPRWALAADGRTETWTVPLVMGAASHPWVFHLGFHADQVRANTQRTVLTNIGLASAISVLLLFLSFLFTRKLLTPLHLLTAAASELDRGNLDVSLPEGDRDEIGRLISAFRSMVRSIRDRDASIRKHVQSLQTAHDSLEIRVEDRTRELTSAAESLKANEARMRAIIEHAADGIITVDEAGLIDVFNPTAERIFGYGAGELVGKSIQPLLAGGFSIDTEGRLAGGPHDEHEPPDRRSGEIVGRKKSGEEFPLHIALSEVQLGSRRLHTAIVRDVSEQKKVEAERSLMNERLVEASRWAGKAEVATAVLHNVGNALNSVNTSAAVLAGMVESLSVPGLVKASRLIDAHADDLGRYLSEDPAGRHLPAYVSELSRVLEAERESALAELSALLLNIEHIKAIVRMQQTHARAKVDITRDVAVQDVVEDALKVCGSSLRRHGIALHREYGEPTRMTTDRHKVIQILVNLLGNAKDALVDSERDHRSIVVRIGAESDSYVTVSVIDTGCGIAKEDIDKIFSYGFTTKTEGHGFGLHSSAVTAIELGGSLVAESEGPGRGATFILKVPRQAPERTEDAQGHEYFG
jgi:PAS domain S-box-containing protein